MPPQRLAGAGAPEELGDEEAAGLGRWGALFGRLVAARRQDQVQVAVGTRGVLVAAVPAGQGLVPAHHGRGSKGGAR